MPTKRIKFLNRAKILQSDIEIKLEVLGPSKRFSAKLHLDSYNFPAEAGIYIDAKQLLERIRFDFGTVARPVAQESIDISRLKGDRVTFDVIIVDLATARKLGSAETVRPTKAGDTPEHRKELLPIDASKSLDGIVWKIEYSEQWEGASDGPILLLDREATRGSAAHFVGNPWVRALVLPAAMREILTRILVLDEQHFDEEGTTWPQAWLRYASKLVGDLPPTHDREEDLTHWIDRAVQKMASSAELLSSLLAQTT